VTAVATEGKPLGGRMCSRYATSRQLRPQRPCGVAGAGGLVSVQGVQRASHPRSDECGAWPGLSCHEQGNVANGSPWIPGRRRTLAICARPARTRMNGWAPEIAGVADEWGFRLARLWQTNCTRYTASVSGTRDSVSTYIPYLTLPCFTLLYSCVGSAAVPKRVRVTKRAGHPVYRRWGRRGLWRRKPVRPMEREHETLVVSR
jgi:hypothetical protein